MQTLRKRPTKSLTNQMLSDINLIMKIKKKLYKVEIDIH